MCLTSSLKCNNFSVRGDSRHLTRSFVKTRADGVPDEYQNFNVLILSSLHQIACTPHKIKKNLKIIPGSLGFDFDGAGAPPFSGSVRTITGVAPGAQ